MALLNPKNRELLIFEDSETVSASKIIGGVAEEQVQKITKKWTYPHLVRQTYHYMEQIQDYQINATGSSAIGLRFTDREKLLGFGFRDIVDGENVLHPRVATLLPSSRGWVDFTRSIPAIALLGNGFGELIRPSRGAKQLCENWSSVSKCKDYLTCCVSTLKEICKKHGECDSEPLQLAHKLYWHKPDKLYESCSCKQGSWKTAFDRGKVLLPSCFGSLKHARPFDCQRGAVIFGKSRRLPIFWSNKGDPVQVQRDKFRESRVGESGSSILWALDGSNSAPSPSVDSSMASARGDTTSSGDTLDREEPPDAVQRSPASHEVQVVAGETLLPPIFETPKSFQMISGGVKRTFSRPIHRLKSMLNFETRSVTAVTEQVRQHWQNRTSLNKLSGEGNGLQDCEG